MNTERTIVVPWDFSNHASAALRFALQQFEAKNLRVICVLERPSLYAEGVGLEPESKSLATRRCERQFKNSIQKWHAPELGLTTIFGDPAAEIVRFATRETADFIVMSTHGRTGIQRMLMGSVAEEVAAEANCPVIMLPNRWFQSNRHEALPPNTAQC